MTWRSDYRCLPPLLSGTYFSHCFPLKVQYLPSLPPTLYCITVFDLFPVFLRDFVVFWTMTLAKKPKFPRAPNKKSQNGQNGVISGMGGGGACTAEKHCWSCVKDFSLRGKKVFSVSVFCVLCLIFCVLFFVGRGGASPRRGSAGQPTRN